MCGIAAIFAYSADAPPVDRDELLAIRDQMIARGPDGAGLWISLDQRIGLAHRRLSIIDLSDAGAQPMFLGKGEDRRSEIGVRRAEVSAPRTNNQERTTNSGQPCPVCTDRQIAITFNGEIYNYRALRAELQARGHTLHSNSDTEVLLHLYAEKGPDMLRDLRGMYAFAIWDARKQGLFLARDPFGIKPLYYADDGRTVRVASQVKALRQSRHIDTSIDPAGHVGFFLWGHVPDPFTLYQGIRALPAGHWMWIDAEGRRETREFCSVETILREAEASVAGVVRPRSALRSLTSDLRSPTSGPDSHESSYVAGVVRPRLRSALADTVAHHLVADVPVGVFLSSGLDSTTLATFAAQTHQRIQTVTLGFDEYRNTPDDETALAELVARSLGTRHQTVWVTRRDFEESAEALFDAMDRPTIDGVNTYFVSMAARRAGLTVALSGVGGDELFGGYPSFQDVPRTARALRNFRSFPGWGRAARIVSAGLIRRFTSPKYAGLLEYGGSEAGAYLLRRSLFMPWELPAILNPDLVREGWARLESLTRLDATTHGLDSAHARVVALELSWYMRHQLLRDSDWASMAHSLEIRVPLVDVDLFKRLAPILVQEAPPGKQDMARSAPTALPDALLSRQKTGFTVPIRDWLLESFDPSPRRDRGLRGWAHEVYARFADPAALVRSRVRRGSARTEPRTALVLVTDAFGGFGGIAKFNRDFLSALADCPALPQVIGMPRIMPSPSSEPLPPKLTYRCDALGSKRQFMQVLGKVARTLRSCRPEPLIICGHVNLLPAAFAARRICGGRIHLVVHGIDAWKRTRNPLVNTCARRVDGFIAVSQVTKRRFAHWTGLRADQGMVLPNCVDLSTFQPGPKPPALLDRYGLHGKRVLLTLGRLASEERYKGFDEVLNALPALALDFPDIRYLLVGDGPDRPRLEAKAAQLGVADRVVFAGRIDDAEKADHYRLADLYVMPSYGEGFGIVYLEAMACGIPVIGSKADGSREALRNGRLGRLVNPRDPEDVHSAIVEGLRHPRKPDLTDAAGVRYFSAENFRRRVWDMVDVLLA